jgi:hypothetical protein
VETTKEHSKGDAMNDIEKASTVRMWRAIPSISIDGRQEDRLSEEHADEIDRSSVEYEASRASALGIQPEDGDSEWEILTALDDNPHADRAIALREAYIGMVDELAAIGDDTLVMQLLKEINPAQTDDLLYADCMVELARCLAVRHEYERSHAICFQALSERTDTGLRAMIELARASKIKQHLDEIRTVLAVFRSKEDWPGQVVIYWLSIFGLSADEDDLTKARILAGRYTNPIRHSAYLSIAHNTLAAGDWFLVIQNLAVLRKEVPDSFSHYVSRTMTSIVSAMPGHESLGCHAKKFSSETAEAVLAALPKRWRDYVTSEVKKLSSFFATSK